MQIPYFHVDAFAREPFRGNPAGVCMLEDWLPDDTDAADRAGEPPLGDGLRGGAERRVPPALVHAGPGEIQLCGHPTLATAFVLCERRGFSGSVLRFETASGTIEVDVR